MKNIREKIILPFILGDGLYNKVKFLFFILLFPCVRKFSLKIPAPRIKLNFNNKSFDFYPSDGSDVGVLRDIFVHQEYALEAVSPRIIVDLGSNSGISVLYFKLIFPHAAIYCFEPEPITYQKLRRNTEQFSQVYTFNSALASQGGVLDFFYNTDSSISSSLFDRGVGLKKISVSAQTLDDVMKDNAIDHIDLLKFDIEGAEFDVFKNFKGLHKVNQLIGEVHEDIAKQTVEEFIVLFSDFILVRLEKIFPKRYVVEFKRKQ